MKLVMIENYNSKFLGFKFKGSENRFFTPVIELKHGMTPKQVAQVLRKNADRIEEMR